MKQQQRNSLWVCARHTFAYENWSSVTQAIPLQKGRFIAQAMSLDTNRRFSSVEQFWDSLWLLEEKPTPLPGLSFVQEGLPALSGSGRWQDPENSTPRSVARYGPHLQAL